MALSLWLAPDISLLLKPGVELLLSGGQSSSIYLQPIRFDVRRRSITVPMNGSFQKMEVAVSEAVSATFPVGTEAVLVEAPDVGVRVRIGEDPSNVTLASHFVPGGSRRTFAVAASCKIAARII